MPPLFAGPEPVVAATSGMDEGHARVRMDEVRTFLDRTWLAWIGGITRFTEGLIGNHRLVHALVSCASADQAAQDVGPQALVRG